MEDENLQNDFENNTEKSITISAEGATIESTYKHKLEISIPKCFFKVVKTGKEGDFFAYDIEVLIAYDSGISAPFQITVVNDIASYLA